MKFKEKNIYSALIVLISMFSIYLISGQPLYLFFSFAGLSYILIQIYQANNYNNNFFNASFLCIILIELAILIYTYIFRAAYLQYTPFYLLLALAIGFFIFHVIYFVYYYPNNPGDPKIPV